MAYTTIDKPTDYFNTVLFTGNGSTQSITGVGFQPDWVWIKNRDVVTNHEVADSVRGANKLLKPNDTDAEQSNSNKITSFDSDGFGVGNDANVNQSTKGIVGWSWLAGTSFSNDASATSVGTLDSSGSTNQTAGFSIVSFTGSGSANQSVAHNLGGTPEMIIFKCRETATDWTTFHTSLGGANKNLSLNSNSAVGTDTDFFANTNPTSTVFSVGAASNTNRGSEGMIAYCFRSIKGYSKFGNYTGNGNADGTFIYTGFKPAFVFIKRTDSTNSWHMIDNKRNTFNTVNKVLSSDTSDTEATTSANPIDFLSNGFKCRGTGTQTNNSSGTYIYMAFAESPFVTSTGIPTTAR
jgi:hypothetical protein